MEFVISAVKVEMNLESEVFVMYICTECGEVFDNISWRIEPHGEELCGCPYCGGTAQKAKKCGVCGLYYSEEELSGGVCDECIDKYKKDFDTCYNISLGEETDISINALLASLIDKSDIEAILIEHIKKRMPDVDCSPFIDEDIYWFGEKLVEEVKKNENAKG